MFLDRRQGNGNTFFCLWKVIPVNVSTNQVWEEFSSRLKQFIRNHVQNEHDTDDILQEVFCKIHSNLNQLKDWDKLSAWVYQVTRNAITDYYRRREIVLEIPEFNASLDDDDIIPNINNEIIPCLNPMINYLPEKYRQAIRLVYVEGLTQKAMAEKLGLSFSGAKSRVQRAREKLKNLLFECCHFEFDRIGNIIEYHHKELDCCYCKPKIRK